ncbi:MAG: branched-chain amino acid transaminase [bacterium]|nr:branched-chain amino acid transaminase [bacterium]
MSEKRYLWENGSMIPWHKGTTHVMNASMHYGVAAFEGIRFYDTPQGPTVFRMTDHLDRFFYSMKALGMSVTYNHAQLGNAILQLIKLNDMKEGYIRPIAWFSDEKIGLHLVGGAVSIQIGLFEWQKSSKDAFRVHFSPLRRIHPQTTNVEAKISGHYVNTHLALQHAIANHFDDAILLDYAGYIAEASAANIFWIKDNVFFTPPRGTILNGITRQTILRIAKDLGYKTKKTRARRKELLKADEIFLCGTAYEIKPVVQIEDTTIGNGTRGILTTLIKDAYHSAVRGELEQYFPWLAVVPSDHF